MNTNELAWNRELDRLSISGASEHVVAEKPDITLNLGSTKCPIFGLKSMKALRNLGLGQNIEIATFNPSAGKALKRVSWMTGTKLIDVNEKDGQFKYLLRKG